MIPENYCQKVFWVQLFVTMLNKHFWTKKEPKYVSRERSLTFLNDYFSFLKILAFFAQKKKNEILAKLFFGFLGESFIVKK